MSYGIKVMVWGDYALFTRPEFKVERYSYDVITPSAARGIIEAIYFKPAICWKIDRIHVYNEPQFTNIRRNEVSVKIAASDIKAEMEGKKKKYINSKEVIQQRAATLLKDVQYLIEAHFELTDKAGPEDTKEKHYNIVLRRMRNGQFYHQPYFGCREFPVNFQLMENDIPVSQLGDRDFGFMLYDMDYSDLRNITPIFFRAKMENGIIDLRNAERRR